MAWHTTWPGITLAVWKLQGPAAQKLIASSLNYNNVGKFEEELLNFGSALMESDLTASPCTSSDHEIALAIASNEAEAADGTDSDDAIATAASKENMQAR